MKYRLWNDRDKCWELGYELPNLGGFSMIGEVMIFGEYTRVLSKFRLEELDCIKLMQSTGEFDSDKVEFWEGDLRQYHGKTYIVVRDGWQWRLERNMYYFGENENIIVNEDVIFESVLVGTLYQNPEICKP